MRKQFIDKIASTAKLPNTLILLALLTACSSPQKAFESQDYDNAFKLALSGLNKGRGNQETRQILKQSLENILGREMAESRRLGSQNNPEGWKTALDINYGLQAKVKEARAFLPNDFEKELYTLPQQAKWLRKSLFTHFFEEGQDDLGRADATGLKPYAQLAHGAFTKARQYTEVPSPKLDSLTRRAMKMGIVYYQVEVDAPFDISYHWEIDRVFEKVEDQSGGFLRVTYGEAIKDADCAIEIRFNSLEIDISEEKGDEDFNREILVEYKTVTDTSGNEKKVPVYETAEGNVVTITKTKTATWDVDVYIDGLTPNCGLSGQSFSASTQSTIREVKISGDRRAVPEEYINARKENFTEEDDMAEYLLESLYEQIVRAYF